MYKNTQTLENEVKKFADQLPYWAKYLAERILSGKPILDSDIETSYSYLLEEISLSDEMEKPKITIKYNPENAQGYKSKLFLSKLSNVVGVNGLIEDQIIEFNPNLTIIYGANGTGKSGYVRLLKTVFNSKAPEEILPDIHISSNAINSKPIDAKFIFNSNNEDILLSYDEKNNSVFEQFSVFDGKCIPKQLSEKNEFEFRPAGLSFFTVYTEAINNIEKRHNQEIKNRQKENIDTSFFEGESEIKTLIENLSKNTTIEELEKYTPFTAEDKTQKEIKQNQYDELRLASMNKEKEIDKLEKIKELLKKNKKEIELLNQYFKTEHLNKIRNTINEYVEKEKIAKDEGIERFNTTVIKGIGTNEWKQFILAADVFVKSQSTKGFSYPKNEDYCLFCHQKLAEDARILIKNYWKFLRSTAEKDFKDIQEILEKEKQVFEKLNFNLFHKDSILTDWLAKNHPKELKSLNNSLKNQENLTKNIILDIDSKTKTIRNTIKIKTDGLSNIEQEIDSLIMKIRSGEQSKILNELSKEINFLEHKEKLNLHILKIKEYINSLIWLEKASKVNLPKRKITEVEKRLSDKYFNKKYIDLFNHECQKLKGNFGIDIDYSGLAGTTYRQLKLKGVNPKAVLSEGEQKVIAIADFIAETQLSAINKGIVFDDPVTSLDDFRKSDISKRLVQESALKQVIVFTHDLVLVSSLIGYCKDLIIDYCCHWVESRDGKPGYVWLNNSPSYENEYRNAEPVKKYCKKAKEGNCEPSERENYIRQGFAALRTC